MDKEELDSLLHDVEELKRAVRRNNPFLREVVSTRYFPGLGLPYGLLIIVYCVVAQALVGHYGSMSAVPASWKLAAWIVFGFFAVVGAIAKWVHLARRARSVAGGAGFVTMLRAVYSGYWLHLTLPAILCMYLVPVAAILAGHPWYIVPGVAIFWSFLCNGFGLIVQRPEYLATGWYALVTSLVSVFFLEATPFVWLAIIWGGALLVIGVVGIATQERRRDPA